jgi:hypothetical protein
MRNHTLAPARPGEHHGPCQFICTTTLPTRLYFYIYPPVNLIEILVGQSRMVTDIFIRGSSKRFFKRTRFYFTRLPDNPHAGRSISACFWITYKIATIIIVLKVSIPK